MTEEIFRHDAYVFEFEAGIVSVKGNEIVMDSTAFYPGGGGQVCDTGTISGHAVTDVIKKGKDIVHVVPGHDLKAGGTVWCSVDWERRYDLMKGHTAEHLLFGSLKKIVPELGIVKIFISPESKYVVVDRDVEWYDIEKAVAMVNKAIRSNLSIRKIVMDKEDPDLANVRVDLDKIKAEEVTVIEIGDADSAACSGIHVMETEELGMLFVDRKVVSGKEGYAIHFRIGWDALDHSSELAGRCLTVSEILGTKADDIVNASKNIMLELNASRKSIRELTEKAISSIGGTNINGITLYSGIFPYADREIFTDASESFRKRGSVSVLVSSGETVNVFLASGSEKVDCGAVLKNVLPKFNGRGGGRKDQAQGGCTGADPKALLKELVTAVTVMVNS